MTASLMFLPFEHFAIVEICSTVYIPLSQKDLLQPLQRQSPVHLNDTARSLKAGEAGSDGLLHWGDSQLDLARSSFYPGAICLS